ncbi:MAG: ribosomal-processing cysteine protease Prp [Negativicutes bacterium]
MIRIDVFRLSDGKISGFRVHGHSGTAARGQDIVCAGISALAQAALLGIGEHLHRPLDFSVRPSGDLRMKLRGEPDAPGEASLTRPVSFRFAPGRGCAGIGRGRAGGW